MNQLCTDSNDLVTAVVAAATSVVTVLLLGLRVPRATRYRPLKPEEIESWGKTYARMARVMASDQPARSDASVESSQDSAGTGGGSATAHPE